jgi:hypothetical protein
MLPLLLATAVAAAPPVPGSADEGRILLWVQSADRTTRAFTNNVVHFKPDGTEPTEVTIPAVNGLTRLLSTESPVLTPGYDVVAFVDRLNGNRAERPLTVLALGKDGDPFVLKEYLVLKVLPESATLEDGSVKIFFTGYPLDGDRSTTATFSFDVKTHAVKPFVLPERHVALLVFRDGKTAVTRREVALREPRPESYPFFVTAPGREPVEFHSDKSILSPNGVSASRDGSVVLINRWGTTALGRPPAAPDVKIIDVKTKTVTEPKGFPATERVTHVVLSPDGKRIAYAATGGGLRDMATRVYVAAADGSGAKVVYKSCLPVPMVAAFSWQ